jgi:RNA polymerase sigma-70 factor (ECF subfamily)
MDAREGQGLGARSDGVPAIRSGCLERFEALALPMMSRLLGKARHLTGNPADAQDLLQETYLRAYRSFDTFAPGTNISAWLYAILRRSHVDLIRRRCRSPRTVSLGDHHLNTPCPAPVLGSAEGLTDGLSRVPEPFRTALVLRAAHDLSYREIALRLGIPQGTVMSRIHRGRTLLREVLRGGLPTREHSDSGLVPRRTAWEGGRKGVTAWSAPGVVDGSCCSCCSPRRAGPAPRRPCPVMGRRLRP